MKMERINIQLPAALKQRLDALRLKGYTLAAISAVRWRRTWRRRSRP